MGTTRRIIIFVAFVAVLVFLGWLVFKPRTSSPRKEAPKPVVLTDYAERDSRVVFTYRGRITGDDTHRSVRITVSRGSRTVELIQGYRGTVLKSQTYENNPEAYRTFVYAINNYNFAKSRRTTRPTETGACPLGFTSTYQLYDNNDQKFSLWGSTCSEVGGTSAASLSLVNQLFQRQITDYNKFVSGVTF